MPPVLVGVDEVSHMCGWACDAVGQQRALQRPGERTWAARSQSPTWRAPSTPLCCPLARQGQMRARLYDPWHTSSPITHTTPAIATTMTPAPSAIPVHCPWENVCVRMCGREGISE